MGFNLECRGSSNILHFYGKTIKANGYWQNIRIHVDIH